MKIRRVVVLASGNGSNFEALVNAQKAGLFPNAALVALGSNRPDAHALVRAKRAGIPTWVLPFDPYKGQKNAREHYDQALIQEIQRFSPDLLLLAGWMRILSPTFLEKATFDILNLHPALPSAYPGLNAMRRAFEDAQAGKITESGVMIHRVIAEVDAGPVVVSKPVPVYLPEPFHAFQARMQRAEHDLIVQALIAWSTSGDSDRRQTCPHRQD